MDESLQEKLIGLKNYFSDKIVIIAYSGGVDSTVIAELAHKYGIAAEDIAEAVDLVDQAGRRNLQLMVGMNFRYLPVHQAIRRMIMEEQLGAPSFAHFTYLRHRDGRRADLNKHCLTQKQPMLIEQSIHHLDLMRYCYGREVEWVQETKVPIGSLRPGLNPGCQHTIREQGKW